MSKITHTEADLATPARAYHYAWWSGKPFPEGEPLIAARASTSLSYAQRVLKGRFLEGEPAIATDAGASLDYARDVMRGPFPAGEPAIATDTEYSMAYAINVLHGRFELGEPVIAKSAYASFRYATDALGGRFPAGELALARHADFADEYLIALGIMTTKFSLRQRRYIIQRWSQQVLKRSTNS